MKTFSQWLFSRANRLLTNVSMITTLNLNKPSYICAKMTMRCNSRCSHCNIWSTEGEESELTTQEWLEVLGNLRRWLGRFRIVFTGGEALLRPDMVSILQHAAKLGIDVELLTNGLIVDDQMADNIVKTGISQVTLSFDGIKPETHDRFRGERGFHGKTSNAIRAFMKSRDKIGSHLRILLKTVISSNNILEITDIATFAQSQGVEVEYQPIEQNYGEEFDPQWFRNSLVWIDDLPLLSSAIKKLKMLKASGAPITNSMENLDTIIKYFEHPEHLMNSVQAHDTKTTSLYCRHAFTNFVISSNGDVRMCFKMQPIGNVASRLPQEIWGKRPRCWSTTCGHR